MPRNPAFSAAVLGEVVGARGGPGRKGSLAWRDEILATVPLFAGISKRHRRQVARLAAVVPFHQGEHLVTEGSPGTVFGVVIEGMLSVVKGRRTVARLGVGEFFGEVGVLSPGPRTASLVARTDGVCMTIKGRDLWRLLETEPGVGAEIARVLAERLRESSRNPAD